MFRPSVKREHVDLELMCRLCLVESDQLVHIFDNNENGSLALRIMACSALEIQQFDALPKCICLECRQLLERFYYFRKKAKNSDTKLRRHLRLINAGKRSTVFNVSDDEEDDDDFEESRRLFARWEEERVAVDRATIEQRKQLDDQALQDAIEKERNKFRAEESVRVTAELRAELEPGLREQVQDELRVSLEPMMRDQIEKQIEQVVKRRQIEQIKREVQEAMQIQKQEMLKEMKMQAMQAQQEDKHKAAAQSMTKSGSSADSNGASEVAKDNNDPFDGVEVDGGSQQVEIDFVFEDNADTPCKGDDGTPTRAADDSTDTKAIYTLVSGATEDDDHISVTFADDSDHGDGFLLESTIPQEAEEHGDDEEENADDEQASQDEEESFMVNDSYAPTEYLEEDADIEEMEVLDEEDEDEDESMDGQSKEIEFESITDNLRQTIETSTGIRMDADFKYKVKKCANNRTKVEVTTDRGEVLVVELATVGSDNDVDNQPGGANVDENGELKIFQCTQCPQAFARRLKLTRHAATHSRRNKGHMCQFCEKWFPSKSSLSRHTRTHTGEKPFKCDVCNRSFIQKEILKRHALVHTGERPYVCEICDKSFTQREILRQHMNRFHTASPVIDLHKCPKCPKTFYHASGLSRHILIHSGRKFPCAHCAKPFNDKSALKRHVASLHADKS